MRKTIFILLIALAGAGALSAENFRMGFTGAADFKENPDWNRLWDDLAENTALFPGFYWEVLVDHVGFGMTYLTRFLYEDGAYDGRRWALDWEGSWDMRYHFLPDFIVDPFVEMGFGCAGKIDFDSLAQNLPDVECLSFSLFAQVGAGAAVRLDRMHLGLKLLLRPWHSPLPLTTFGAYELHAIQCAVFAGFSL